MRSSINLSSPIVEEHHQVEKLLIVAVSLFIGVFAVAGGMLGYLVYVRNEVAQVVAAQTEVQNTINKNPQQKVNALVLKQRLNDITKILASRGDVNTKVTSVISLLPSSLDINSFGIDDEKITVEISSSDLSVFDTLLENDVQKLQADPVGSISKMSVDSFVVQPDDPRYTMTVSFDLAH